jgi:hypothetical protein
MRARGQGTRRSERTFAECTRRYSRLKICATRVCSVRSARDIEDGGRWKIEDGARSGTARSESDALLKLRASTSNLEPRKMGM